MWDTGGGTNTVPCLIQLPPLPSRHRPSQEPFLVCHGFLLHTGFLHDSQALGGSQEAPSHSRGDDFRAHQRPPLREVGGQTLLVRASEALQLNCGFCASTLACECQLSKFLIVEKNNYVAKAAKSPLNPLNRESRKTNIWQERLCSEWAATRKSMQESESRKTSLSLLPTEQGMWDIC